MKTLRLALKAEYFGYAAAGTKLYEYRLANPYWRKRLIGKEFDQIVLTLGYPRNDQNDRILRRPWRGYKMKKIVHREFGSKPVIVFAIRIN